jgi:hypothetical protein
MGTRVRQWAALDVPREPASDNKHLSTKYCGTGNR